MPTIKLILDTRDAIQIQKTNSVTWSISDLTRDIRKPVNWIQFHSLEMPNLFYNIISSNNTITWEVYSTDGTTLLRTDTATIATGHYMNSELITALKAAMDAEHADTYTITESSITNKLTLSNDGGFQLIFKFSVSTIGNVLGFTEDATKADGITGNRPIDLRGVTSMMIQSNLANTNSLRATGAGGSVNTFLADVKVTAPYGSTIFYHNDNMLDVITVNRLPNTVTMELRNRNNVLLDNNDFNWRIAILVNYEG